MSAFQDDPNLSDSSRRVLRRVMERKSGSSHTAPPPRSSAYSDAESMDGREPTPRQRTPTRTQQSMPTNQSSRMDHMQHPQDDDRQRRREEMRRNLNALREEVYGGNGRSGRSSAERSDGHVERDHHQQPRANSNGRPEWERHPAGVPSNRRVNFDDSQPRPARRQLASPGRDNEEDLGPDTRFTPVRSREDPPNATREERYEERIKAQDTQIRRLAEEMALLRKELKETREEHHDEIARQRQAALDGQQEGMSRLAEDVRQLSSTAKGLQRQLDSLSNDVQRLNDQQESDREATSDFRGRFQQTQDEVEYFRRTADKMAQDLQAARGEVEDVRKDFEQVPSLRRDVKYLKRDIENVQGELTHTRRQVDKELKEFSKEPQRTEREREQRQREREQRQREEREREQERSRVERQRPSSPLISPKSARSSTDRRTESSHPRHGSAYREEYYDDFPQEDLRYSNHHHFRDEPSRHHRDYDREETSVARQRRDTENILARAFTSNPTPSRGAYAPSRSSSVASTDHQYTHHYRR